MRALKSTLVSVAVLAAACRGESPRSNREAMERLVDSLRVPVERATGLTFKQPPRSATRSRKQVRAYLVRKLDEELPASKLEGMEAAYRLFGLLPDTVGLRSLLLDLYTEQVAGYYDPDSATLFGVEGADRAQLRLVLAHEMVHALQGQYLRLDSIMDEKSNNDRLTAAQSVLEGQATLASIEVLAPGQDIRSNPEFWDTYRDQVRQQQTSMPVFTRAPLVVREALIFPYLAGAEFMQWWSSSAFRDTVPYGPRMPVSTEQILHPDRYARGDQPLALAFPADSQLIYEDVLGEAEIRVLIARLRGAREVQSSAPIGWAGDRFAVYRSPDGPALVWYVVWDDTRSAERFTWAYGGKLRQTTLAGYRSRVEGLEVGGKPATMYVVAPSAWAGWREIPKPAVRR
jgi:hypothetical protein